MTLRSTAITIAAAAGFLLGHGPASAAAPKHVILIMMENHGTDTLLGNKEDAPFLNELIAEPGVRYATQYYGVTHPSLPNYLALIAGDTMGIHDDCKAGADVNANPRSSSPTPTSRRQPDGCSPTNRKSRPPKPRTSFPARP
jgi:phosphatidylinositol-3-phosphatase